MPALRKGNLDAMTTGAIRKHGSMDVVQAARIRITNMFSHGMPIYFGFSGGKDSLVLGHLVLELIKQRKIDPALLVVIFVDEEAIFDDVDRIVREWRLKFMMEGAAFRWYCLEVKHFNCFNNLESDESFICWDRNKKESWVREPPDFAIKSHPMLKIRKDNYQAFFPKITRDGIHRRDAHAAARQDRRAAGRRRRERPAQRAVSEQLVARTQSGQQPRAPPHLFDQKEDLPIRAGAGRVEHTQGAVQ